MTVYDSIFSPVFNSVFPSQIRVKANIQHPLVQYNQTEPMKIHGVSLMYGYLCRDNGCMHYLQLCSCWVECAHDRLNFRYVGDPLCTYQPFTKCIKEVRVSHFVTIQILKYWLEFKFLQGDTHFREVITKN